MTVIAEPLPISIPARWTGRILSGLVIVFLMIDGTIKLVPWPVVTETMDQMGYGSSETMARSLGFITIVCTVLYSIPPTSILGAILLTGYLGGAIATTSANLSGLPPATTAKAIEEMLGDALDIILDGGIAPRDTASTVIRREGATISVIREGSVTLEQLREAWTNIVTDGRVETVS